MSALLFALVGLAAGVFGGLFGVGGGIIIVPALIYGFGFNQKLAQGTSLVVFLLPVGLLSVMNYYKEKQVDFAAGLLIAAGLFAGAYVGSKVALSMDDSLLRKIFAVFLVIAAVQLFFKK
jgi:uncharacterized protein